MTLQGVQNLLVIQIKDTTTGKYHQIQACEQKLVLTKAFSDQTFDTITINRSLELLFTDRQTQPGIGQCIRSAKYCQC